MKLWANPLFMSPSLLIMCSQDQVASIPLFVKGQGSSNNFSIMAIKMSSGVVKCPLGAGERYSHPQLRTPALYNMEYMLAEETELCFRFFLFYQALLMATEVMGDSPVPGHPF